jgi:hypothetical protein
VAYANEKIFLKKEDYGMVEFFLSTVRDIIVNQKNKEEKKDFLLRSLFAECKKNLEIIKIIKKDKINEDYIKNVKTLGNILNNEIGQLVLLNQDGILDEIHAIQDDLNSKAEINNNAENEDDDKLEKPKTLKQAIDFYVNKIETLKTLANLSDDEFNIFPKIRVQMRLENIEKYLKVVKMTIEENLKYCKGN